MFNINRYVNNRDHVLQDDSASEGETTILFTQKAEVWRINENLSKPLPTKGINMSAKPTIYT